MWHRAGSPVSADSPVSRSPGFDLLSRLCVLLPVLPPASRSSDVILCLTWELVCGILVFHSRLLRAVSLPLFLRSVLFLLFTPGSGRRAGWAWSSRRLRQAVPASGVGLSDSFLPQGRLSSPLLPLHGPLSPRHQVSPHWLLALLLREKGPARAAGLQAAAAPLRRACAPGRLPRAPVPPEERSQQAGATSLSLRLPEPVLLRYPRGPQTF